MKTFFAALALATLIGGSAFVTSADAAACAPRFRWILAMLSLLRGRDLRRTPDTRVAQAGWLVKAERAAEVCLRIRRVPTS